MGVEVVVDELNRLYEFDIDKYVNECNDLKRMGYRIYRNEAGKHKVIAPQKIVDKQKEMRDSLNKIFGGVFSDLS